MRILGMRCDRCGNEAMDEAAWKEWGAVSFRTPDGQMESLDLCPMCAYIIMRELRPEQAA